MWKEALLGIEEDDLSLTGGVTVDADLDDEVA